MSAGSPWPVAEPSAEYEASLPAVPLSRCPFTRAVFAPRIDVAGLAGPWWRYEDPARPLDERPPTFFAFTGALRLAGPPEPAPFVRKPGPEAPFVAPAMLLHPDTKAVVSQVTIGAHVGYPVCYFADPIPERLQRFNDWGTEMYWAVDSEGMGWDAVVEEDQELDFELRPWIERGKLAWIAPGDASLTLRTDAAGCPYLGLPGRRAFYVIEPDGEIWEPARGEAG